MPDYQKGKIYKITNDVNDIVYIGSTVQRLSKRMNQHRECGKKTSKTPFQNAMTEIGIEHFEMKLVRKFPCQTREELEAEEDREMDSYDELYNSKRNGKHSVESRLKITGKRHGRFTRGSIQCRYPDIPQKHRWTFEWRHNGQTKSRSFSCNKYGSAVAKVLAHALQDITFPE